MRAGHACVQLFEHIVDRIGRRLFLEHGKLMDHVPAVLQRAQVDAQMAHGLSAVIAVKQIQRMLIDRLFIIDIAV